MNRITPIYKLNQNHLVVVGNRVLDKTENNEILLPPPPALAKLKVAVPELHSALSNALGMDSAMVSIKNDKKALVQNLLC